MDLLTTAERIASMDRSPLEFQTEKCLHSLDKYAVCDTCYDICPVQAIQPGEPPSFDNEKCQTCLACLPACPVGAYAAVDNVPALLNCVVRSNSKAIELICQAHPKAELGPLRSELAIRVRGCLASLGTGTYLILIAMGLDTILLRLDACFQCPWGSLQPQIEKQRTIARKLLMSLGLTDPFQPILDEGSVEQHERPLWIAENPPLSRRDLFRLSSYIALPQVLQSLSTGQSHIGNDRLSQERRRIVAAMAHFAFSEEVEEDLYLDEGGFAEISISDECSACGVCARACPTEAISFTKKDDVAFELTFMPQACIACEICVNVCQPGAITMNVKPATMDVFRSDPSKLLYHGMLTRCQNCNVLMAAKPSSRFCTICEFRRKKPFGSSLPPGFKGASRIRKPDENST